MGSNEFAKDEEPKPELHHGDDGVRKIIDRIGANLTRKKYFRAPGEIKHNLEADHDFYNLTMTYRLDSDIKWAYGGIIDKSTGATIAPAMHPPWRQPDNDFYGS